MKYKSFFSVILASSVLCTSSAFAEIIREIKVEGNNRVERDTIVSYLKLKKGEEYSSEKERESFSDLYNTNLFDNIYISHSSGIVTVKVEETLLVVKVNLIGNSRVKTSTIEKELVTHKGSSLSNSDLNLDVQKIKDIYRKSGRYAVNVKPRVEREENNRAIVSFEISEGPKTGVRYINFVGNKNYKDSELRSVISTKQSAWFRFMDTSDTYDPDRVEYDKYLLKQFYGSLGYADFRIISSTAELAQTKENFTLTYVVDEGEVYNFGNIEVVSAINDISLDRFDKIIKIKSGEKYNSSKLETIAEEINDKLSDDGYTGLYVYPDEVKDRENKTISIKFIIEKGSKTYIDKIKISGNLKTRDNVIRRQIKLNEGDLFNRSAVNKGEQNLRNLDYFETVSVETQQSDKPNRANILVDVGEKSTSSIQFEVGYSTMDGPVGRVNFVERNLLGTGRYLTAGVDKYTKKTSYHMGLTDPYFLDRDLLVGGSFFKLDSKGSGETPYGLQSIGGTIRAGYEVATDLRHDSVYLLKRDRLSGTKISNSKFIEEQFGTTHTSSLSNSLTYDKTDSIIVPKNGYVVSATETVAGLGGDTKYLKHEADFKIFKSFSNNDYTVKFSGEVGKVQGYGGKKVRISDRFSLGDFSLRGFEASGVGPRDKVTKEALGGQNYYTLTGELIFPVGLPKEFNVSGSLFTDVGALWGFDIKDKSKYSKNDVFDTTAPRVSVGVGIVWVTRFAPIRLDYAIPIKKEKYDETQHWHFRFSTSF
jgi:outer membrane protein insertion porin family